MHQQKQQQLVQLIHAVIRHRGSKDILLYDSSFIVSFRGGDARKAPRLTSLWPEWNEADVNAESWDVGSGKKKESGAGKARADTKSASSVVRK